MTRYPSKQFLVFFSYPAAVLCLSVGLAASTQDFPSGFDWRYQLVSGVLSQLDNPTGYRYFCLALILASLLLWPLPEYYRARLTRQMPRFSKLSSALLRTGFFFSILIGLEKLFFHNVSSRFYKAHEILALVAFTGLFLGTSGFWYLHYAATKKPDLKRNILFWISLTPMMGAAGSQAYLFFTPNTLGWVGPHWAALGIPVYLSLAFWEWLVCVSLLVYLYLLLIFLPDTPKASC
jgi:hypothetical protein